MGLGGKVSASVDLVLGVSILEPLLFILYIIELFHIVGNNIEGYADDTTIYAVFLQLVSRPQVMESLNQNLAAIDTLKKLKYMVISRSRTNAPDYGDLTLGSAELEEVQSLHIFGVTLDFH